MKKKLKCFVCHKEINEEEDYVFKGQTVHKGECLKSMIDEYNAVRNLQIRNKRLCAEIERLNNIINELEKYCNEEIEDYDKHINSKFITDIAREQYEGEKVCFEDMLGKLQELKGDDKNGKS